MVNTRGMRVYAEDLKRLRHEVKLRIATRHAVLKDVPLTDAILFKFVVEYALGGDSWLKK